MPISFEDKISLQRSLKEAHLSEDAAARLSDLAKHSIKLKLRQNSVLDQLGMTRFGGHPDLPSSASWPVRPAFADDPSELSFFGRLLLRLPESKHAKKVREYRQTPQPLNFLGQINLAEMSTFRAAEMCLPQNGMLYFFYDDLVCGWGYDPKDAMGFKVLYADENTPLVRAKRPKMLQDVPQYTAVPLAPETSFEPCISGLHLDNLNLSENDDNAYSQFLENWFEGKYNTAGKQPHHSDHQLCGWPDPIQNPMEEECALVTKGINCGDSKGWDSNAAKEIMAQPNDWVLLIQIDSDEDVGFDWGDAGRLYFWIKRSDLEKNVFDEVWLVLQSY